MSSILPDNFGSFRQILRMAGPLILSQTGVMLMHIVDALFLAHYSREAIAAVVPSAMVFFSALALFQGVAGYTTTFVAQYIGAGRPRRVGAIVWQGVWISLVSGLSIAALSLLSDEIFLRLGHPPAVAALEAEFFRISCYGAPLFLIAIALSGFFSGRGDNLSLAAAQILGLVITIVLDYAMIFGRWGFPEMGIRGAAIATVAGQGAIALVLAVLTLRHKHRDAYDTWGGRSFDAQLMRRLIRYGVPAGGRMLIEFGAWTLFIIFVGRIGDTLEQKEINLAANNIVMRINTLAFFPMMGVATAVATLVGQAQGARRPDLSARCAWRGLAIGEAWMILNAIVFVLFPVQLIAFFRENAEHNHETFARVSEVAVPLMYFVAFYCLFDAANLVILGSLQGAGDTRFTAVISAVMHTTFLAVLFLLDYLKAGVFYVWALGTTMVAAYAVTWLLRFLAGRWRTMRVIEPEDAGLVEVAEQSAS